jgi:hypothetical protein
LRYAPGNLFVAFVAAGIVEGGWPSLFGCFGAVTTMLVTKREWAALGVAALGVAALGVAVSLAALISALQ